MLLIYFDQQLHSTYHPINTFFVLVLQSFDFNLTYPSMISIHHIIQVHFQISFQQLSILHLEMVRLTNHLLYQFTSFFYFQYILTIHPLLSRYIIFLVNYLIIQLANNQYPIFICLFIFPFLPHLLLLVYLIFIDRVLALALFMILI